MARSPVTVYVDAGLVGPDELATLSALADVGLRAVIVGRGDAAPARLPRGMDRVRELPDPLPDGAWHLTAELPSANRPPSWTRTVVIGPKVPRRRALTGLRTARDVRAAVLDLVAEAAVD